MLSNLTCMLSEEKAARKTAAPEKEGLESKRFELAKRETKLNDVVGRSVKEPRRDKQVFLPTYPNTASLSFHLSDTPYSNLFLKKLVHQLLHKAYEVIFRLFIIRRLLLASRNSFLMLAEKT